MLGKAGRSLLRMAVQGRADDEDANEALRKAIESNRPEKVTRALKKGANANLKDEAGQPRLVLACLDSHEAILELLLASGANVNKKDNNLRGPLYHASAKSQLEAMQVLLDHEACVDAKDAVGRTALMHACKAKTLHVVDLLLRFKSSVLTKDLQGKFPLMLACEDDGSLELVQKLVVAGADVNMCADDGRTALHEAAMKSALAEVVYLVEQGANLGALTDRGETALSLAQAWGNTDVEAYLAGFSYLTPNEGVP